MAYFILKINNNSHFGILDDYFEKYSVLLHMRIFFVATTIWSSAKSFWCMFTSVLYKLKKSTCLFSVITFSILYIFLFSFLFSFSKFDFYCLDCYVALIDIRFFGFSRQVIHIIINILLSIIFYAFYIVSCFIKFVLIYNGICIPYIHTFLIITILL